MKNKFWIIGFFLLAIVNNCSTTSSTPKVAPSYIIEGDFDYQGFRDTCHWSVRYDSLYIPESNNLEILKAKLSGTNMLIYAGTWCGDSKHQVPRMMKILHETDYDMKKLEFRLLDRSKKDKMGLAENDSIKFIPTFILLRDSKEIGRIVESPKSTIEQDLVEMLINE